MEKRRFGRTGHESTVAIFGAVALGNIPQDEADRVMEGVIAAGVNHIDVAPSYGQAELRLGPWMERERRRFFLGCKTTERSRDGAAAELRRSLERLRTDRFDLYQIHAVTSMAELDQVFAPDGAMQAALAARDEGLTRHIGITGHGYHVPEVFQEALARFDFDSILFPVNFIQYADETYRREAQTLIRLANERDVGIMTIKSIAKGPWGEKKQLYDTWYEPFTAPHFIQQAVNFVLSQPVTGLCTGGDYRLLPDVLSACQNFKPMSAAEQQAFIQAAEAYTPLFAPVA